MALPLMALNVFVYCFGRLDKNVQKSVKLCAFYIDNPDEIDYRFLQGCQNRV
tara:strand:+ start:407 stop:562 length:156 start_codon:yes stop_codon:yes gene_type:complete